MQTLLIYKPACMEHFAGAAASTVLGAIAGYLLHGQQDCLDRSEVRDVASKPAECPVCPTRRCPVYPDMTYTHTDTHMQLGDIAWRVGYNDPRISGNGITFHDVFFSEKGSWNSTTVKMAGDFIYVSDTKPLAIESHNNAPKLKCKTPLLQNSQFVTGPLECRVIYGDKHEEQRSCIIDRGQEAKFTPESEGEFKIEKLEILCPYQGTQVRT